jgi:hypothetical protein
MIYEYLWIKLSATPEIDPKRFICTCIDCDFSLNTAALHSYLIERFKSQPHSHINQSHIKHALDSIRVIKIQSLTEFISAPWIVEATTNTFESLVIVSGINTLQKMYSKEFDRLFTDFVQRFKEISRDFNLATCFIKYEIKNRLKT